MTPDPVASPDGAHLAQQHDPAPSGYAGAVSRLAAYVLDIVLVSAAVAAGSAVVAFLVTVITGRQLHLTTDRDLAGVGLLVGWLAYLAGSWATTGCTLGMAVFGLRVVRHDGRPATATSAVLRALALPLSVALLGLGFLGILFHAQRRALHDLIAGTAVVYASRRSAVDVSQAGGIPPGG